MTYTIKDKALAIAPKITGSMSIMGSVFIITDILKSKEKMGRTYSRILLVMSTYDFMTSVAQGMSTWPIPEGSGIVYASGTTFTCSFQGFFTQLGVGAPMYNCSLSFYYLIVIAFAFSEERVKQIEWFMHGIPLCFSIGSAIAGLPLTLYNNATLWCWIAALPSGCENGTNQWGEGPCERGQWAWIYRWAIYYGPVWFCVLTITVNMTVVSYLVWTKERASHRFRFGHRSNVSSNASHGSHTTGGRTHASYATSEPSGQFVDGYDNERAKRKAGKLSQIIASKRARADAKAKQKQKQGLASQVFWQAFFYVLGFYITWIFPTVLRLLQTIQKPVPYWIILAMSILLPMQGFFNFLVYVRPRVVQYKKRHPDMSVFGAVSRAIQRTMTVLYTSESRAFDETELQDIEALDPCYALQHEKGAQEQVTIVTSSVLRVAEGTEPDNKKSQLTRDSMNQRRMDELKLLSQENPSFYEGNESRLDMVVDMDNSSDDTDSVGGFYLEDEPKQESAQPPLPLEPAKANVSKPIMLEEKPKPVSSKEKSAEVIVPPDIEPSTEKAPERPKRTASTGSTGTRILSDSKELKEILTNGVKEVDDATKEANLSKYPALKSTELCFYPEFSSDPDFFFM